MTTENAAILPSKTHRDENFPVASRLIARPLRRAVLAFYRYVRAADDIADDASLTKDEKLAKLDAFERALVAGDGAIPPAANLHAIDREFGAGIDEARLLLDAFRQDVVKSRYADWAELLDYCRRSANPVGRFLLRLHGESDAALPAADALCSALQILNHLQDLDKDRKALDRIYLPTPWMEMAGGEAGFFDPANATARREVIDAALDRAEHLVDIARELPSHVKSRRLAAESAVTIAAADKLAQRLRRGDPILMRVQVSKPDLLRAFVVAVLAFPLRRTDPAREVTKRIVRGSGSSFKLGMSSLDAPRRRAIHAVYAFCRVVDDIADGRLPIDEKRRFLDEWRREIDSLPRATTPIGRELAQAVQTYDLPRDELHAVLDGMEADAQPRVRIADSAAFDLYCRRVAGAVGALSIRIFGAPQAHDFAITLGHTLQIVNVLRDVDDDAAIERVYVPLDRLAALGVSAGPALDMVAHPQFALACDALADEARAGFAAADAMLRSLDRRALKPAILMMEGYRAIFARLDARGFAARGPRIRLGMREKARLLALSLRARP